VSRIPTVFLISVYGLVAMAGLMLAFAEGSPFPEILTPGLAIVAYVLTDRTRTVHLPVLVANMLGVIAFLGAGWQMRDQTLDQRVLVAAHLLVYLSWIVLFQKKTVAQYWWMCALAVLQVAVGSILTIDTSYGGMLVAFMFVSIWTLSLMSLYEAYLQYEAGGPGEVAVRSSNVPRSAGGWRMGRKAAAERARTLWMRPSAARGAIQLDPDERWLGLRYTRSIVAIGMAALVVAAAFFLFIPRLWAGRTEWGNPDSKKLAAAGMTGFTNEVRLGELVPLLENSRRALQIRMFDSNDNPIDLEDYCAQVGYIEPLFRGATLEIYEDSTWKGSGHLTTWTPEARSTRTPGAVRQQILMEPIGTSLLFAIHPVRAVRLSNPQDVVQTIPFSGQMFRPETIPTDKALAYTVFSPPAAVAANDLGLPHSVFGRGPSSKHIDLAKADPDKTLLSIPDGLKGLRQLAFKVTGGEQIVGAPGDPASDPSDPASAAKARRLVDLLCHYLRDSGEYVYSLDTSAKNPKLDPVEDFVLNRKAGHCEYFASALVLMLRAVGVPTRMVSGFKGGTVNTISGAYEVEQRHAHVWVEALIGGDRWLTVDPTPAARDVSVASFAAPVKTVHELASVVDTTWSQLMNMSINEQQNSFYVPIRDAVENWWSPRNGDRPLLAQLYYGVIDFATDPTQWFTMKGIIAATLTGAIFATIGLLIRLRKRIWHGFIGLWKRQRSAREIRIAFYERFEAICRQLGLVRSSHQTQREFAGSVGARIRQVVASADGLPDVPPRLVELFYRVRFGDENLAPAVVEQLDRDLTSLEGAIRDPRRRGSGDRPNGSL
jgi:protein-glutamine gamma-glutamyltransferase